MPELQGEPEDISREKARLAAQQVTRGLDIEQPNINNGEKEKQMKIEILN